MSEFIKHDVGKLRFDLLEPVFVEGIVAVLTHGAQKYADDNWQKGERKRYVAALGRHWSAYLKGEALDAESNKPHLYHIACCLMFLDWMDRQLPKASTWPVAHGDKCISGDHTHSWNVPVTVPK